MKNEFKVGDMVCCYDDFFIIMKNMPSILGKSSFCYQVYSLQTKSFYYLDSWNFRLASGA